jgi:hypothetical protein
MGLVLGQVSFPGDPPGLEEVADRITARSGLPVRAEPLDSYGMYRLHGRLSFICAPEVGVELYCYTREQRQRTMGMFVEFGMVSPEALEAPLRPGCVVHLKSYVGVEPTLFLQAQLALEELGGTLSEPLSDDLRQKYGGPVTLAEVHRRVRAEQRAMATVCLVNLLLLPVQLPLFIVGVLWRVTWTFIKAPGIYRELRQRGGHPIPLSTQDDISEGLRIPFRRRPPPSAGPS